MATAPGLRYRLLATDIDGTLLDDRREVTPRARRVIRELQKQGIAVVLSTGRPPRLVCPLHESLGLADPIIAYNGAIVFHPGQMDPLLHYAISQPMALMALAAFRSVDPALTVGLEMADEWHVDRIDDRLQALIDAGVVESLPIVDELERAISASTCGVSKLYCVAPATVRLAVEQRLSTCGLDGHVVVTGSGGDFFEIQAAAANKGAALRSLAKMLGIPMDSTVVLGDEENDVPALAAAGLSIAMGNACDQAKRVAHVVAGRNDADGWAEAVERYVLSAL